MKRLIKLFFGVVFLLGFAACTAAPVLKDYPERQIDRPYTLPKGVANWEFLFDHQVETDRAYQYKDSYNTINPFIWREALSDTWEMTWTPLPLYFSHEIARDESGYWGVSFGSGFSIYSSDGWELSPVASLTKRTRMGSDFALDATLSSAFRVPVSSTYRDFTWQAGLTANPLYQLTSHWVAGPTIGIFSQEIVWSEFSLSNDAFKLTRRHERKTRIPLGASTKWLVSRQWELGAEYLYHHIGYDEGYTQHEAILSATHYW